MGYGPSPALRVAELFAGVRQYCRRHRLDMAEFDRKAHGFYLAEILGVPA